VLTTVASDIIGAKMEAIGSVDWDSKKIWLG